jgi:hypothetical protein
MNFYIGNDLKKLNLIDNFETLNNIIDIARTSENDILKPYILLEF